ncbi:hypothetical protein, partial [Pseudomonas viridiflava]|uniref:hypothetical protein n=1 Tax=Pseudomonas viridiflava TaxID=33069 RepID=UPI001981BEFF
GCGCPLPGGWRVETRVAGHEGDLADLKLTDKPDKVGFSVHGITEGMLAMLLGQPEKMQMNLVLVLTGLHSRTDKSRMPAGEAINSRRQRLDQPR